MIVTLRETTSTNDYAKKLANCGVDNFTTVVAYKQTAGKGRLGRSFDSPEDDGIYMSIILYPDMKPEIVSGITIMTAMAVKQALEQVVTSKLGIKWPNDIVIDGKKVCGILTEASMTEGTVKYVVVGIGINVNNNSFPAELEDKAVSLKQLSGENFDKKGIIDKVLNWFKVYYNKYAENQKLQFMVDEYNAALVHKDELVNILNGAESFQGLCQGIDDEGALLVVRHGQTQVTKVISGEVSVRGVYGYV